MKHLKPKVSAGMEPEYDRGESGIYLLKDQIVRQYKRNLRELKKIGSTIQTEIRKININKNVFRPSDKKREVLEETLNTMEGRTASLKENFPGKRSTNQNQTDINEILNSVRMDQQNWEKEKGEMMMKIQSMEQNLKKLDNVEPESQKGLPQYDSMVQNNNWTNANASRNNQNHAMVAEQPRPVENQNPGNRVYNQNIYEPEKRSGFNTDARVETNGQTVGQMANEIQITNVGQSTGTGAYTNVARQNQEAYTVPITSGAYGGGSFQDPKVSDQAQALQKQAIPSQPPTQFKRRESQGSMSITAPLAPVRVSISSKPDFNIPNTTNTVVINTNTTTTTSTSNAITAPKPPMPDPKPVVNLTEKKIIQTPEVAPLPPQPPVDAKPQKITPPEKVEAAPQGTPKGMNSRNSFISKISSLYRFND